MLAELCWMERKIVQVRSFGSSEAFVRRAQARLSQARDSNQRGQLVVGPSFAWHFVDTGAGTISGAPRKALRAATSLSITVFALFRIPSHIHHQRSRQAPTSTINSNNPSQPFNPSKSIKMTGGKSGGKASGAKSTAQS